MSRQRRFLITTALEKSWSVDEPVLFLGEWCCLYSRRDKWSAMNKEVLPYHWDDREKLYIDYQYLTALYERLLPVVASQLNKLHSVEHSIRYWRILVGPWLLRIIHIVFDRWECIQRALDYCELNGSTILSDFDYVTTPADMSHLMKLNQGDDWNHQMYGLILKYVRCVPLNIKPTSTPFHSVKETITQIKKEKRLGTAIYSLLSKYFIKDQDLFFYDTYLSQIGAMNLQLRFLQVPQLRRAPRVVIPNYDETYRKWGVANVAENKFETFLCQIIPTQIPRLYVEGHRQLNETVASCYWPQMPKLIFTSNALWYDDVVKAYTAAKVEQGSALVYGQHGGGYRTAKFNLDEQHELTIADRYLSMGWTDSASLKVTPLGFFKYKKRWHGPFNKKNNLALVTLNIPRYSFRGCSESALNVKNYIENSFHFVQSLKEIPKKKLVVRLGGDEKGWFHHQRWGDRFPTVALDSGEKNIYSLMKTSRLVVSTYNQTTLLETLALGIPTIAFFDLNNTPLRTSAIPFYQALKRVGIFHETPESAAEQVNIVWDDVDAWWSGSDLQQAVSDFTYVYCRRNPHVVSDIHRTLKEVMDA